MFKALMRVRFAAYFYNMFSGGGRRKNSRGKTMLFAALMLYVFVVFGALFGLFFSQVADPFHAIGADWLYFGFFGIFTFAMLFILSIFMTTAQLYEAKDNELLLSLPVPPAAIVGSRIFSLLAENYVFELLIFIPSLAVWCAKMPVSAGLVISFVVAALFLPLLAFAFTGLFAWLVSQITSRVRNKTALSTAFSLLFLLVYFVVYSRINIYIRHVVENGASVADAVYRAVRPVYWLGSAVAYGNVGHLLLTILVCAVPFAAVYAFLSATFLRTAGTKRGAAKVKYERRALRVSTSSAAFTKKELTRIGTSSAYMLNAGLGLVFMVGGSVALLVKPSLIAGVAASVPGTVSYFPQTMVFAVCLILSMTMFSASSVSLEGRSVWIPLSAPVAGREVLFAKARAHLTLTLPAVVITGAALSAALKVTAQNALFLFLVPSVFAVFTALLGVFVNLRHPRLDWVSEVQVIKQGASVLIVMLVTMAAVFVPGLAYLFWLGRILPAWAFMTAYAVLLAAVCAVLWGWICRRGEALFSGLLS